MFAKNNHKQFQESIYILSPHNFLELKDLSSMCNRTYSNSRHVEIALVHSSHTPPPPHSSKDQVTRPGGPHGGGRGSGR